MELFRIIFSAMGGECEIQLEAPDRELADNNAKLAIDEVHRIETKYSRYRPDSFISRINASAGAGHPVICDDETLWLLDYADTLFESSDGLFDITSGILRHAWDFKEKKIPSDAELESVLGLIGWQRVAREKNSIYLPVAGMEIDFGGFGKEYAADRAAELLSSVGVTHAYVNLGGDVRAVGSRPDGKPWVIGIKDPRKVDSIFATFPLESGGLATSGDYEKFFEKDGFRYCHILNPFTGRPVNYWRSVSVVAPLAIAAGSYSTIAMLKEAEGTAFLDKMGCQYFCIDHAGQHRSKSAVPPERHSISAEI
jgi:thiamine biosynthesis lipoprotein